MTTAPNAATTITGKHFRLISIFLLASVFLTGVAYVSMLPPFEAFDEPSYWSNIQFLADTGRIPRYGETHISKDVETYPGPMAAPDGQPYIAYFQEHPSGSAVSTTGPSRYASGTDLDYEAQHPPLFYLLMAEPFRLAAGLTWPWHMFALRLTAWTIAFAGFAWGALTTQAILRGRDLPAPLGFVPIAWPFFFPQFFLEFTRVTNDTLCLLLMAALWSVLAGWLRHGANRVRSLSLGLLLALGLLTKAFFLPVTAGVAALLLFVWAQRRQRTEPRAILIVVAVAVVIGGPWYLFNFLSSGVLTGAGDTISLDAQGGLLAGLRVHFSPMLYGLGLVRMVAGFCWAGTWSFVHPSRLFIIPLAILILLPFGRYFSTLKRRDLIAIAPVFIVAPVLAGLLYHLLGMVAAAREDGGTPGWFFHIFAGPLSLALALGWARRSVMLPLVAYSGLFSALVLWMQAAFFSGCLPRTDRGLVSLTSATCVVDVSRLGMLALPDLALAGVVAALAMLALAGIVVARKPRNAAV